MSERFKEHAWKACVRQRTVGSNPTLSANLRQGFYFRFASYGGQDGWQAKAYNIMRLFQSKALKKREEIIRPALLERGTL